MAKKIVVEVRGDKVEVDVEALESWEAFEIMSALDNDEVSNFGKVQAALDLARIISGLTKDDIVELCGGKGAKATDVIGYALEIFKAASSKNSSSS